MTANGCVHLDVFKTPESLKTFRIVHAVFVVCATADARKTKLRSAYCHTCRRRGPLMHACLHCVFFGCQRHIREHCRTAGTDHAQQRHNNNENRIHNNNSAATTVNNNSKAAVGCVEGRHLISMELGYGQIHCASCGDYVYDEEMDGLTMRNKFEAGLCKKRLFSWTSFVPSAEERELFRYNPKRVCVGADSTRGLRGLLNLGATCFMNSIVQALIHTPLLRDYFLAERHKCAKTVCLVCELARLFQEFYRGVHIPLALDRMLYLLWTHAHHLAAYDQQDAHECFIATLDLLHLHCVDPDIVDSSDNASNASSGSISSSGEKVGGLDGLLLNGLNGGGGGSSTSSGSDMDGSASGDGITKCPCIIDQIFTGGLQSDLVCQTCSGVSTKIDPIWDISLELNAVTVEGLPLGTLTECLEVFTRAERLSSNVHCVSCQSSKETTKRLTLKTLPIVVSIHLKRFEHTVDESGKKISTLISFPETLDMTPFMSDTALEQKNYQQKNSTSAPVVSTIPSDNRYSLFAVVSHSGTIHSGHYIAYVRQQRDYWYTCDDHVITRTTLREVLASEGYLLFYHKHTLDYD